VEKSLRIEKTADYTSRGRKVHSQLHILVFIFAVTAGLGGSGYQLLFPCQDEAPKKIKRRDRRTKLKTIQLIDQNSGPHKPGIGKHL
jgi:hypothetical protein